MKLPADLKGAPRCDLANISVFTENLRTAMKVATKACQKPNTCGYVLIDKKRVYWCLYGIVNDPETYVK